MEGICSRLFEIPELIDTTALLQHAWPCESHLEGVLKLSNRGVLIFYIN